MISIKTCTSGQDSLIARVASIPLPSGRLMSISTTSGLSSTVMRTASPIPLASPTTAISALACSRTLRPARRMQWSSTIIMRIGTAESSSSLVLDGFGAVVLQCRIRGLGAQGQRKAGLNDRASLRLAANDDIAAGQAGVFTNQVEPKMLPRVPWGVSLRQIEPHAIVSDQDGHGTVIDRHLHPDVAGLSVSSGVCQSLLENSRPGFLDAGDPGEISQRFHGHRNGAGAGEALDRLVDPRRQSGGVGGGREQRGERSAR